MIQWTVKRGFGFDLSILKANSNFFKMISTSFHQENLEISQLTQNLKIETPPGYLPNTKTQSCIHLCNQILFNNIQSRQIERYVVLISVQWNKNKIILIKPTARLHIDKTVLHIFGSCFWVWLIEFGSFRVFSWIFLMMIRWNIWHELIFWVSIWIGGN